MEQRQQLKQELVTTRSMKMLTTAYQEHALEQINIARYSVLASRDFAIELTDIFSNVRTSYQNLLERMVSKDKKELAELRKRMKNGKEVLVLISANNKLYGELIPKICRLFISKAQSSNSDLVIVGRDGRNFVDQSGINRTYQYFEIPDTNISQESLKPLLSYLLPYENVLLYCGKFNNVVSQEAIAASITGDHPLDENDKKADGTDKTKDQEDMFLFEPSIEYVMDFFENQIFSIILSQTISEAQLARFGSRIQAMETAQNNMQELLEVLLKKERRLKSMEINKKQLQLFAGKALWGRK
jgi:F0F1-type ATP synthase gamma subunit